MKIKLFIVDAFTDKPFSGNPAAVCFLENPKSETWMQNVAAEMNLSETAFLVKKKDGFGLRWFTPTVEVDLCGHATLASAHVLWEEKIVSQNKEIKFYTKSGLLTASFGTDQYPVIARSVTTKQSRILDRHGPAGLAMTANSLLHFCFFHHFSRMNPGTICHIASREKTGHFFFAVFLG